MTEDYDIKMELKEQSEALFREKCNDNDYTYMYIEQSQMTFSSKMWKDLTKRPDYLLSLQSIGSVFVDVKARSEKLFFEDAFKQLKKQPPAAFRIDLEELKKFKNLQNETSLKVWFAVTPYTEKTVINEVYFFPVDKVDKFCPNKHLDDPSWKYVQIPKSCFSDCSRLAHNKCAKCDKKYCMEIDKYIELWENKHK